MNLRLAYRPSYPSDTPTSMRPPDRVVAWFRRTHKQINVVVGGTGLNLHRRGGISLTGLPRSGGTSLLWGSLRADCAAKDHHAATVHPDLDYIQARVFTFGPFMVRVGRDF